MAAVRSVNIKRLLGSNFSILRNFAGQANSQLDKTRSAPTEITNEGANVDKVTHTGQIWDKDDYRRVRFVDRDKLVNERFAIDYIEEDPIIVVKTGNVVASGGGGALGHPKIFLNLDRNEVAVCGYSGRKFIQKKYYKPDKHGPSIDYEDFLKEDPL